MSDLTTGLKEWMSQYTSKENFNSLDSKIASDMLLCSMWMNRQEKIQRLESQLEVAKEVLIKISEYNPEGIGELSDEALKKIDELEEKNKPEYIVGGDGMYKNE